MLSLQNCYDSGGKSLQPDLPRRGGGGGGGDAPASGQGMTGAGQSTWPEHF